jgi:hypothetical protein
MTNPTALAPNGAPLESKFLGNHRSPRVAAEIVAQEMCHTEAEWISITLLAKHKDEFIQQFSQFPSSVLSQWDRDVVVMEDDSTHRSFFFHKKRSFIF